MKPLMFILGFIFGLAVFAFIYYQAHGTLDLPNFGMDRVGVFLGYLIFGMFGSIAGGAFLELGIEDDKY